ncbi:MAG: hypothetical protein ACOVSW_21850 [Candidatus Kapaibacteriota bacterium]
MKLLCSSFFRVLVTASVLCCVAYSNALAQTITIDTSITTFDKLTTTLISFTASEKPTIRTEPSLEGQYRLIFEDGKGSLRFDKPMRVGHYTITLSIGTRTAKARWSVLPTILDSTVMKRLIGIQFYAGSRLALKSKLPIAANLPINQFKIRYRFGANSKTIDSPYSPLWFGPYIPASAKPLSVAIIWQYPPTGECTPLFHYEFIPQQAPPQISCDNRVFFRTDSSSLPTSGFDLNLHGLRVDTLAISADSSGTRPINATFSDIEVSEARIDYNSPDTQLRIYIGEIFDVTSTWVATGTTFTIAKNFYNATTGTLALAIAVRDLPASIYTEPRTVRGTVAIRVTAKITNPLSGAKAHSPVLCVIPVQISYQPLAVKSAKAVRYPPYNSWIARNLTQRPILCKDCSDDATRNIAWRVTSPELRQEVYEYLLRLGRRLPNSPPNKATPLVLDGTAKRNGVFDLKTIRFGNEVVTHYDIVQRMPSSLQKTLSEPISRQGKRLYQLEVLSAKAQEEERSRTRSIAHAFCFYERKEALRTIENYSYAGYALYEADSAITQRLRESITPPYPRTPSLEEAERECTNTPEIIRLASQRKAISDFAIYQNGNSSDCELVKNYYQAVAGLIRIGRVYVIVNVSEIEPRIIGLVCTQAPTGLQKIDPDFLKNALNGSISSGTLDAIDLLQFPTQEYEQATHTPIKGSIIGTSAKNLYEYCLEGLRKGVFIDRTSEVFPFPAVRYNKKKY